MAATYPADLPVLVGRQYVQRLRTSKAATLASPTAAATDVRQGVHLKPSVSMSSPSMSTLLVKAISPNRHVNAVESVSAPTAESTYILGYRTAGAAVLASPDRARAKAHREFVVLETPAQTHEFRFAPDSLMWGYTLDAMSLARIYGEWEARYVQVPDEMPGLDKFFRGGHRHYITPDDAAELTAAGFGDYIRTEVLK